MKYLFLLRHAKTEKAEFGQDDMDRSLMPEGRRAASHLGARLLADKRIPDRILCSPARRTQETARLLLESWPQSLALETIPGLYHADTDEILGFLAGREEDSLMVVGHNPAIAEALETLSGEYGHVRPGTGIWLCFDIRHWEKLYDRVLPVEKHIYRAES